MSDYVILLGSNLGNKLYYIEEALNGISAQIGIIIKKSSIYKTAPWGFESDDYFLNQAILVESNLTPHETLKKILLIERQLGRIRSDREGYESRIIDIDIILIDSMIINDKDLIIPHPRMSERMFVLKPLEEIIPNFIHPIKKISIKKILLNCNDNLEISKFAKK